MDDRITVPQRIKAMGLEQGTEKGKELAWRAGALVREAWLAEVGAYPPKGNRQKTSGRGSHCFALYPSSWVERVDGIVRRVADELDAAEAAQMGLFS